MDITIYHNPVCGTSRNALALIRQAGFEPKVVEYLKTPPAREELEKIIRDAGLSVRESVRQKEKLYTELGLDDAKVTDAQLLDAMVTHPVLINRPFVVTPLGTRLARPLEVVREILPLGALQKVDGDAEIQRVGA